MIDRNADAENKKTIRDNIATLINVANTANPPNGKTTPNVVNTKDKQTIAFERVTQKPNRGETRKKINSITQSDSFSNLLKNTHAAIGMTSLGQPQKRPSRMVDITKLFIPEFTKKIKSNDTLATLQADYNAGKKMLEDSKTKPAPELRSSIDNRLVEIATVYALQVTTLATQAIEKADSKEAIETIKVEALTAINTLPEAAKGDGPASIENAADTRSNKLPTIDAKVTKKPQGIFSKIMGFIRKMLSLGGNKQENNQPVSVENKEKPVAHHLLNQTHKVAPTSTEEQRKLGIGQSSSLTKNKPGGP